MMRAAIAAHRGREIKTMGYAFLVLFRGAVNAVQCALAAQRAFADYNRGEREKERIIVRIAIHLGEVSLTGTDVFGDDVKMKLEVQPVEGATLKNIAAPPPLFRIAPAPGI